MPPPPSAVVQAGASGPTNVKVRRITEVTPISTTAPPPAVALKGQHKLLVVLVETADAPWPKGYGKSRFDEMLFARSTLSLREFYRENSYGLYDVTGQVVGPVRIPGSIRDYGFKMGEKNTRVTALIQRAVTAGLKRVDIAKFDTHDVRGKPGADGILDHLMVVYPAESNQPQAFAPVWPHRGSMDFDAGRIRVNSYTVLNHGAPLGVFVHEFAHDIGLPDLYDRDYTSHGAGGWSLMASGSWAQGGSVPSHISAWGKSRLGWLVPEVVSKNTRGLKVPSVSEKPFALKIPIGAIDSREYFLIENRRKVGFDKKLDAEGIVIWHIDDTKGHNDDEKHKMVDVVEAAPVQDLDFLEQGRFPDHRPDVFFKGGKTVFDDNSEPSAKMYDGSPSNIRVEVKSAPGRVMTVDVQRPEIFNPGGIPYVLEKDAYRYGRFAVVPTGKGSEALVRFDATPGGFLVFGTQLFLSGKRNRKADCTLRIYDDKGGQPGRVLLSKTLRVAIGPDGYAWVNERLIAGDRGHRLAANQRIWVGVTSDDGSAYPILNPFSQSKQARFRRAQNKPLVGEFRFRTGSELVSDYVVRLTGFGYVDGGGRPEPMATDADPLVEQMRDADRLADAKKLEDALGAYEAVLASMQQTPQRFDNWIPVVVNSIGVVAYELKKYDIALEQFETSLRRVQAAKDRPNEADIFENMGETALFAGDVEAARRHCDRSRRINTELKRTDRLVENHFWLARAFQTGKGADPAQVTERLDQALALAEDAFSGAEFESWKARIAAARTGESNKTKDEERAKETIEKLKKQNDGPTQKKQVTDLLQFLMEDTK